MKTRTFAVAAITCLALLLAAGCAGHRHATLKTEKDGSITHGDWNASIFQKSVSPWDLAEANRLNAEAYRIRKQADTLDKMMTGLQEGKTVVAASGKFIIGLINNDRSQSVYLYHPEIPGLKLTAEPRGGFQIFEVRDIPHEIALYNTGGRIIKKVRPRYKRNYQENGSHKKLVGNILVDLLITVNLVHFKGKLNNKVYR